jgi:glycosyltransferase involved in cell wall biosynthesis
MNVSDARIGYAGYSPGWGAPGDRRRFCAYAEHRGISIDRADLSRDYDVVVVTHNGDLAGWTARKRREGSAFRFILELADSYLVRTSPVGRALKAIGRYALGTDSRFSPDFLRTLVGACKAAEAVICSTEEQRDAIRRYNPNVFISFDYFGDDLGPPKSDYSRSGKLRLVWEGQSVTLSNLATVAPVLNALRDDVELHVVSDPVIPRFFNRFGAYPSARKLEGIESETHFHRWDRASFSSDITAADLAIIPIDSSNAFAWGKPENKLVMMWQLGMPVLASATPAYERAMQRAGADLLCHDAAEWRTQLERMIASRPSDLERFGQSCRFFADRAYSREEFLRRFDAVFQAIGFDISADESRD